MKAGIRKLLHDKKKLPIDVIENCIKVYAEKNNLYQRLLSDSMRKKEGRHFQKFGKYTSSYLNSIHLHIEMHFGMFLNVVTEQTGVTFKYNRKKTSKDSTDFDDEQDFSDLAYSGVTDDL